MDADTTRNDRTDDADRALLLQIACGDRSALSALYRDYYRRLGRFLGRMTRRVDLIDEAINDCFWVVWQKADGFRGDARPSTWIMGIAYRCMLKALRQSGEEIPAPDDDFEPSHDPRAGHELRDWLAKGMRQLSPEQRVVLELAYGGGHSVEEIAAIMQSPVGTVKARMFHARMKLRNLLPEMAEVSPEVARGIQG